MNKLKKIFIILILAFSIFNIKNYVQAASDFDLEQIDFEAVLDENGNMEVTETWEIDINGRTNTLFKTFSIDPKKYDSITNVTVKDVTANKQFKNINKLMNHVTTDCYYGMKNQNGEFEIAWGINLSSGKRTYEVKYTVNNVITVYNDCAELYWQFIGNNFEVPAEKVTGTIILPNNVEEIDNLRVWAHGPLNGEIHATSNNTVKFEIAPFIADTYVEIRLAITEPNMFYLSNKTSNTNKLQSIIEEETLWAEESNQIRETLKRNKTIFSWIAIIASIGIGVFFIVKIVKNIKTIKETPRPTPTIQLEYFREIPSENANPVNAAFLYYFNKTSLNMVMPRIFSATMLNLALKKKIEFEVDKNKKKNEEVTIKLLGKDITDLRQSEQTIYQLLAKIGNSFTMKEFEKYAKNHHSTFSSIIEIIAELAKTENIDDNNYKEEIRKTHDKYSTWGASTFIITTIISFIWLVALEGSFLPLIIFVIPAIIYAFTCFDIAGRFPRTNSKRN